MYFGVKAEVLTVLSDNVSMQTQGWNLDVEVAEVALTAGTWLVQAWMEAGSSAEEGSYPTESYMKLEQSGTVDAWSIVRLNPVGGLFKGSAHFSTVLEVQEDTALKLLCDGYVANPYGTAGDATTAVCRGRLNAIKVG